MREHADLLRALLGAYGLGFASPSGVQSPQKIEGRKDDLVGTGHPGVEWDIFTRHKWDIFIRR